MATHEKTHLLVDGENIDATLGSSILGGRPDPEQRPRWDTVREFVGEHWGHPVNPLFFLNASGNLPRPFVQALLAMEYQVIPLAGAPGEKVVDMAILATLEALRDRPGHVLLGSHDGDFADELLALLDDDERRLGVLGFREFMSQSLTADGRVEVIDIEDDVQAFSVQLPRMRIIPIQEFDPTRFL